MSDKLQSSHLLVSFKGLQDDGNRKDTQDVLELALKHKVIPLSMSETEILSFSFDDFVAISFARNIDDVRQVRKVLDELVSKGYNNQFVLENALRQKVMPYTEKITTYRFESSTSSLDPLCTFLNDLCYAEFCFGYYFVI